MRRYPILQFYSRKKVGFDDVKRLKVLFEKVKSLSKKGNDVLVLRIAKLDFIRIANIKIK